MEILIKKEVLLSALQLINSVTDKSAVKPILSNFLLKTLEFSNEDGMVEVSATDHEISILAKFPAKVIQPGGICISARKVYDICKEFQGDEVHIKSNEQLWTYITSGKSQLKLPAVDVGLYPQTVLEKLPESIQTSPSSLKKIIDMTLFAAQTNESRRNLMGVCVSIIDEGTTRWLATDGHRLSQLISPVDRAISTEVSEVIIPRKALAEVRKALDLFQAPLEISFDERTLQFSSPSITLKTRLIEGRFPNCDPIIPKKSEIRILADRERLMNSLRIVSLISTEKLKPVKISLSTGLLKLESEKAEYGEANDEIGIDYQGSAFQIGFNAKYLLEVLQVIQGDTVSMEFSTSMSPCLIKDPVDETFLSVIMPLRIEW